MSVIVFGPGGRLSPSSLTDWEEKRKGLAGFKEFCGLVDSGIEFEEKRKGLPGFKEFCGLVDLGIEFEEKRKGLWLWVIVFRPGVCSRRPPMPRDV